MRPRTLLFAAAVHASAFCSGQSGNFNGLNYQAIIRNTAGDPMPNQSVSLRIEVQAGLSSGYIETHGVTTNAQGLVSLVIGQGTPTGAGQYATFAEIPWTNGDTWNYQAFVDIMGGTNYSFVGGGAFRSVPFALHALSSSGWEQDGSDLANTNTGNVGIGTGTPAAKLEVAGNARVADPSVTAAPVLDAALEVSSTTGALVLPRMTTAQRDLLSGTPGMMIFNTDARKFQGYAHAGLAGNAGLGGSVLVQNTLNGESGSSYMPHQHFRVNATGTLDTLYLWVTELNGGASFQVTVDVSTAVFGQCIASIYASTLTISSTGLVKIPFATHPVLQAGQDYGFKLRLPANTTGFLRIEEGSQVRPVSDPVEWDLGYQQIELYENNVCSTTSRIHFEIRSTSNGARWVDLH